MRSAWQLILCLCLGWVQAVAAEDPNQTLKRGLLSCNPAQVGKALEAGANPNLEINGKAGALRCAFDFEVLDLLFAFGLRGDWIVPNDFQHLANADWPVRTLDLLLRQGLDVNAPNSAGMTLMHYWAESRYAYQLLELALVRGGDPNGGGERELAPLHHAVRAGRAANAELLLAWGARIDHPKHFFFYAKRNYAAVQVILDAGLDPNTDLGGRTPLHWAVSKDDEPMVKLLLEAGADPERRDAEGRTPLLLALTRGDLEMQHLLTEGRR